MRDLEAPTYRDGRGWLVTRAQAKFEWALLAPRGRVHKVTGVIVRWNFLGGTRARPDVTFVMACGPQRHEVQPIKDPCQREICVRCEGVVRRTAARRGDL